MNYKFGGKDKLISLLGDKNLKIEDCEHIINFPGGFISVSRTSKNDYWVHVGINTELLEDVPHLAKIGEIDKVTACFPFDVVGANSRKSNISADGIPLKMADTFSILIKTK